MTFLCLSINSRIILDFVLFWNCKLQNRPNMLRFKCQQFTYLSLQGCCIHIRGFLDSKFQEKNRSKITLELKVKSTHHLGTVALMWCTYMCKKNLFIYIFTSWHSLLTQDWYCSQSVLSTHSASVHWPSSQRVPGYNWDFFIKLKFYTNCRALMLSTHFLSTSALN